MKPDHSAAIVFLKVLLIMFCVSLVALTYFKPTVAEPTSLRWLLALVAAVAALSL